MMTTEQMMQLARTPMVGVGGQSLPYSPMGAGLTAPNTEPFDVSKLMGLAQNLPPGMFGGAGGQLSGLLGMYGLGQGLGGLLR